MVKISIVIPIYNKEAYIEACMESLLRQDFDGFEIVAVDDGSTDRSGELCDRIALTDRRIRVFHQSNGGVTAARRFGVEQARGRYIVFVDSDDELMPHALETMYRVIEETGADEVVGTFQTQTGVRSPIVQRGFVRDVTPLIKAIATNKNRFPVLWAVIFRKEILEGCLHTPRDIIEGEDLLMQMKVLMKSPKVFFIENCVYAYNLGVPNSRRYTLELARRYDEELLETLKPRWGEMESSYVFHQLKNYERFLVEKQDDAMRYYRQAITAVPSDIALFHRTVWALPPSVSRYLVCLYRMIIKHRQKGI